MEFETAEEAAEAINTLHLSEVRPSSYCSDTQHTELAKKLC